MRSSLFAVLFALFVGCLFVACDTDMEVDDGAVEGQVDDLGGGEENNTDDTETDGTETGGTEDDDGEPQKSEYDDYRLIFTADELKFPGKKGFGGTNYDRLSKVRVYWAYNWNDNLEPVPDEYEYVPMRWSASAVMGDNIMERLFRFLDAGTMKRLLGFNEPDSSSQANMAVSTAISAWNQLQTLRIPLASPGVTDNAAGREWLYDFMTEVIDGGYRVDYIAIHCYSCVTSLSSLKSNLNRTQYVYYKDEEGRVTRESDGNGPDGNPRTRIPIVLTEFASTNWSASNVPDVDDVISFLASAMDWMEGDDLIAGYAWFSFGINSGGGAASAMFDDDGNLTELGEMYRDRYANEEFPLLD